MYDDFQWVSCQSLPENLAANFDFSHGLCGRASAERRMLHCLCCRPAYNRHVSLLFVNIAAHVLDEDGAARSLVVI